MTPPPVNPPPVQSLWVGERLSPIEQLCVSSFLHHGHEFHLYRYGELAGVPAGARVMDAGAIIPQREVFMHRRGTYAIFSDWFRWALLERLGGWWVDMDVVCLKPFMFDDRLVFGGDKNIVPGSGERGSGHCHIDILSFPAGHAFCRHMRERCAHPNRFVAYDSPGSRFLKLKRILLRRGREYTGWGEAGGPCGFTRALEHYGLLKLAKPYRVFSPYLAFPRRQWQRMLLEQFDGDVDALFPGSYSFHIGNEYLRLDGYDKSRPIPERSLLGRLSARYR
ncbi:MAG: glycosyltransferase [Gammaproteobacteria bacterium]|nr:glycosyltransferase [Gammaproteobacteria bacterium]